MPFLGNVFAGGQGGTSSTTHLCTLTGAVPAGSTILGIVTLSGAGGTLRTLSVTDSVGNTWTVDVQPVIVGTTLQTGLIRGTITTALAAGNTVTVTSSTGSNQWGVVLDAFSGLLASSPLDQVGSNTGTSASTLTVSTAGATTQATELVYAGFGTAIGTVTPDSPYTKTAEGLASTRQSTAGYRYVTATGVQTATATTASTSYAGVIGTYKEVVTAALTIRGARAATRAGRPTLLQFPPTTRYVVGTDGTTRVPIRRSIVT